MTSAMASSDEFVYSKLPQGEHIRILSLRMPERGSKRPRVRLTERLLAATENSYTAISYAWGNPSLTKSILVNDLDFRVGENIWQFLSQARQQNGKSFVGKSFWIDAICINQADTEEKNEQVQLMGKIYERAREVTIWLGSGNFGTEKLFRCLRNGTNHGPFFRSMKQSKIPKLSKRFSIMTRVVHRYRMPTLVQHLKAELALALLWLFEDDYWKRTWIVQECLLAPENSLFVCCGKECLWLNELEDFEDLQLEDNFHQQPAVQEWTRFLALFSRGERGGRIYNPGKVIIGYADWYDELFTLLQHIQSAKCSILHDKIFGISSLVQHNPRHEDILINYDMSLEELFFRSLACWTTGRLTIKLARQLMLNLNLDLAKIRAEVRKHELHDSHMGISARAIVPPIDFLILRLGTVIDIQTVPASPEYLGTHPTMLLRFDGLYSARLDVIGSDWLSTWSSTRCDSAIGLSLCPLELGDVIFAFFDSMACLVFRKSGQQLVKIGCAILADGNDTGEPSDMSVIGESLNIYIQELNPHDFVDIEIHDNADAYEGREFELELNSSAAMGVISCDNSEWNWPPQRCVESQRHLRTRY